MFFSNGCFVPCSSNGRTTDSDSVYGGSNPSQGSILFDNAFDSIYNMTYFDTAPSSNGRTVVFGTINRGSNP